ncbi:MAG: hypothetical protein M0R32_02600 [Candidatus Cloacimonetes bacterium]|jgi:hypothetical protein|nr:hypothetical protein [Candidatus Cloacimonadota bacterium]
MKYGIHNLSYIALGVSIPISVDGNLKGYGAKIGETIYTKAMLVGFDNGEVCNGDSLQECFDWMNKVGSEFLVGSSTK